MSLFSKSQYIWLASHLRDRLYQVKLKDRISNTNDNLSIFNDYVDFLVVDLFNENHNFNTSLFKHNIYCEKNHLSNETCPFNLKTKEELDNILANEWINNR